MLRKLLQHNISRWQLVGYALAATIGLAIVMIAALFYRDLSAAWANEEGEIQLIPPRNIVISKQVSLSSTFAGSAPSFSVEEIDELTSQPWCDSVAAFRAADYSVWLQVSVAGRGMQTAMFFESVPDNMVDIDSDDWQFNPEQPRVPIVLSKEYLSLYNFGFASSGRMPVLSESTISKIPMTVILSGNGLRQMLPARIVGFSSWLNTIAVPESFMDWAHERFGSGEPVAPSRLIVAVSDPANPSIDSFLDSRDYQVAGRDDSGNEAARMLSVVSSVVAGVGLIITALALFILVLSLYLLVHKNRRIITGLIRLGYTPAQVARPYCVLVSIINFTATAVAAALAILTRSVWLEAVVGEGEAVSVVPSVLIGVGLMLVVTIYNICVIRRLTRE